MNSPNALHPEPHAPQPGVRYPIKLGKSIVKPNNARSLLSLRFSHVPSIVHPHAAGVLIPAQNACAVELPLSNQPSRAARFDCQRAQRKSDVRNYALVFAKNAFWLERVDDVFNFAKAGTINSQTTPVPAAPVDRVANDPDSWMDIDSPSGSPITPEGNEGAPVDDHPPIRSHGGKSIPVYSDRRMVSARGMQSLHTSTAAAPASPPPATRPEAVKTVPTKAPTIVHPLNGDARPDVEEEGTSSEEDDSSDDSDSDSSAEYTDSSSEEE
ncbi:hypothetical protein BWQ96_01827 [Gracilariopsis chorda]|uniref:Transcription elongation factor Eaf N-terminal domain-containing protein n=1 Tax=Gracilariopsis chorda TaxID=448386 RepID=A0A2V3J2Z6_9FLOR|nr:hypothetical protein BWQ96_01827 [Gracilariopsis chorda]|eukprot:PXF48367.1 hypothetical protein BWQ96_01827 [Gracilariopsis chorda]